MKKIFYLFLTWLIPVSLLAQNDSLTTQDQVYNRPFIALGKSNAAVGGYVEGNTNYFVTDGVTDGFSMELRRFNLFVFSSIGPRIRFISELEFEHGTREINLETAMLDFKVNPLLEFRAGILLTPIGAFNQNHDSPRWDIIDRPLVSTLIIPSTLSEVGFGFHGKKAIPGNLLTYDAYVVNGLGSQVILNSEGRTFLPAGKHVQLFAKDNNGTPMYAAKFSLRNFKTGEIGLSWLGGVYNDFRVEGQIVDEKRRLNLFAADVAASGKKWSARGEAAFASVQVPDSLTEIFGSGQFGFFADFSWQVFQKPVLKWEKTRLLLTLRIERVDFHTGSFKSTGLPVGDDLNAVVAGISLRPGANAVIRANYRHHWQRDAAGNAPVQTAGFQFGVASYF